jgi:glyoxylase-like metal-dependent hydrolase (beta-lactamase superfamily II)
MKIHTLSLRWSQAYLIETDSGLYLIDAGVRGYEKRVLEFMRKLDRSDLRLIFITHAHLDHYGSAAALRNLTGAPIAIHHSDGDTMTHAGTPLGNPRGWGKLLEKMMPLIQPVLQPPPTRADVLFSDGDSLETFGLQARVLHTPGHTPGSSCLILEDRFVFAGDLLSTSGRPHVQRFLACDWVQMSKSLKQIIEHGPELTFPGHGPRPIHRDELRGMVDDGK